ncbi:MAG: EMC3/TMCO1 family protein [Candidatus Hydrothermarchaeaceae archaeon]
MFEFITEPIFWVFDNTFGLLFGLFGSNQEANVLFGIFLVSALVSAIIVLITAKVVDQKEMKKLKARMSKVQERLRKAQKDGDKRKAAKIQKEMMHNSSELWQKSMKPMFFTMIPIILIFTWLRNYEVLNAFVAQRGYAVLLPFVMPMFGDRLGWLGWYVLTSFATSPLIRKLLKVEGP